MQAVTSDRWSKASFRTGEREGDCHWLIRAKDQRVQWLGGGEEHIAGELKEEQYGYSRTRMRSLKGDEAQETAKGSITQRRDGHGR